MNAIIHFTFIFGVVPRDAIEEKRVPRLVRPPSFFLFLNPARKTLNSTTDRPCYSAALNFSRTFLIYTWHQHTASQPAEQSTLCSPSYIPFSIASAHRCRSVGPCQAHWSILASLPVFRSVASRARFVCLHCVGFILPACLLHTSFLGPSAKMIKNPPSVQFRGGGEEARFFARKRRALFFN